jgi:hypothetical protein
MNEAALKNEFNIRYYRWAIAECEKEFNESFPILSSFRRGSSWKRYQFLAGVDRDIQWRYLRAKLRDLHKTAAMQLGETMSSFETELLEKARYYLLDHCDMNEADVVRGKSNGFAKKPALRKAMVSKFMTSFGKECYGTMPIGVDGCSWFDMSFYRWDVRTHFWYGRQHSLISFSHNIISQERIDHPDNPEITAPARVLCSMCWVGFNVQWQYLFKEEVDGACDMAVSLCRRTFAVLPQLLDGLSFS